MRNSLEPETPVPVSNDFDKAFFKNSDGTPKTFACGWAPETQVGDVETLNSMIHSNGPILGYNGATHCNVEFDITEKFLIAKMINPSYPNDPTRWNEILRIPITQHYYLEPQKDRYGRTTDDIIENSQRSEWKARPKFKLDYAGLTIHTYGFKTLLGFGTSVSSVDEESLVKEYKKDANFLGFSMDIIAPELGSLLQARYRFNFLEFKHDPKFKQIPYHPSNSKFLNTLHIVGKKIDGLHQVLKTVHWDFRPEKLPYKIRLHGFPKEYEAVGHDVVKEWNIALTEAMFPEIKKPRQNFKKFFDSSLSEADHFFDMRHHTITWVSDKRISKFSPLGIGMVHSDVRNGKVLWGGVMLYGGMIENYLKSYISSSIGSASSKNGMNTVLFSQNQFLGGRDWAAIPGLLSSNINSPQMTSNESLLSNIFTQSNDPKRNQSNLDEFFNELSSGLKNEVYPNQIKLQSTLAAGNPAELLGLDFKSTTQQIGTTGAQPSQTVISKQQLLQEFKTVSENSSMMDMDRRFIDVAPMWPMALEGRTDAEFFSALKTMVKGLMLHEMGHMLGLGHQFKENILPKEGTVPAKYLNGDPQAELAVHRQGLKKRATEKAGFTNYTSVMGYRHPRSEIATDYADLVIGPHDKLALRYIYRGEYPVFEKGKSDFEFLSVLSNGRIPDQSPENPKAKTAFFPSCSDSVATFQLDPYCDRFDRGSTSKDIAQSHIKTINDYLISRLHSLADDSQPDVWSAEQSLWARSLTVMGRLRVFYDYMRLEFADDINEIAKKEQNIYDFYPACKGEKTGNKTLEELFLRKPKLKELCLVNGQIIDNFKFLMGMQASDFSRHDKSKYFWPSGMTGGDVTQGYGSITGPWRELSALPLKTSALYALTTSTPFVYSRYFGLRSSFRFADVETHYSYASLYPLEYTDAISDAIAKNIKLGSVDESEKTILGQLALSVGGFLYQNQYTNDSKIFPDTLLDRLRNQTNFKVSYAAVFFKENYKEGSNTTKVVNFTGEIYDFETQRTTPAKDKVFMLPGGKFMVRGEDDTLLLPVLGGKVRFFGQNKDSKGVAYGYVIKIDLNRDYKEDSLSAKSVKTQLHNLLAKSYDSCIAGVDGKENGLQHYFNDDFKGFDYSSNIGGRADMQKSFFLSVEKSFSDDNLGYYDPKNWPEGNAPDLNTCIEAQKGIKAIVGVAAALQGYYLGQILSVTETN